MNNDRKLGKSAPHHLIDPNHVPPELHPLIPYAEKWGIPDRELQKNLLYAAPLQEIQEMYKILYPLWDEVWKFTQSDLPRDHPSSYSVTVFDCFRDSFGIAGNILANNMPESWIEIIGWPESFPVIPYNPAKIPPELQPLIPYIEKWVRNDDAARSLAVKIAPHSERDEVLSICDQIGEDVIRSLIGEMFEENDGTHKMEAYVIALLMEIVDEIRFQKRGHS